MTNDIEMILQDPLWSDKKMKNQCETFQVHFLPTEKDLQVKSSDTIRIKPGSSNGLDLAILKVRQMISVTFLIAFTCIFLIRDCFHSKCVLFHFAF